MYVKKELQAWLDELSNYKTPDLDALPDLDLYMDQVTTFMDRQMQIFMRDKNDKLITPSMINNYVKGNVIPSPIAKKYSKKHLAYILSVCSLKQVLPISEISKLFVTDDFISLYKNIKIVQDIALNTSSSTIKKDLVGIKKENEDDELKLLALKLAIEANASKIISERILFLLDEKKKAEIEELKAKTVVDEKKKSSNSKKNTDVIKKKENEQNLIEENAENN